MPSTNRTIVANQPVCGQGDDARSHRPALPAPPPRPSSAVDALLQQVAAGYAVTGLTLAGRGGLWGDHLRWRLTGAAGQRFFLKEPPAYLQGRDVEIPERVHRHVRSRGGPVVELMRAVDGRYHLTASGRILSLQRFAEGAQVDPADLAGLRRYGMALARFTGAAAAASGWPAGDWTVPRMRLGPDPDLPGPLAGTVRLLSCPGVASSALARLTGLVTAAAAALPSLPAGVGPGLRPQLVHGDPNPFNCLDPWPHGEPVLVDLDDARWGLPLWDLAQAVTYAAGVVRATESSPARVRPAWDESAAAAVLDGYRAVRPLTGGECRAFAPYLRLVAVGVTVKAFELEEPGQAPPPDLAEHVEALLELVSGPVPGP